MIKSFTQSLLLLLLTLCGPLRATPSATEPTLPSSDPAGVQACNLPPPTFFSAISVGPTWFSLSWSPVPFAMAYHIITTDVATGIVVDNRMVPASINGVVIDTLLPNRTYRSKIWTVCSNGQESSTYTSLDVKTIVIDVVVLGYPEPIDCLDELCVVTSTGCTFPWNTDATTYFKIAKIQGTPAERYFALKTPSNIAELYPDDDNSNVIEFPQDCNGQFVEIFCDGYSGSIAKVTVTRHALTQGTFYTLNQHEDFRITRLQTIGCPEGRPDSPISWGNDQSPITPSTSVVVSPNPFTDQMDVYLGVSDSPEPAMLRLYDTQGREVVAHRAPAGQEKYSLATAALPPGIYFLRVESAGQLQTVRVVKTR